MRLLLLCTLPVLLVMPASLEAQRTDRGRSGGAGFVHVGIHAGALGDLNDALGAAGYPDMPAEGVTVGGGGFALIGRLVIGGQGHGIFWGSEAVGGREVELTGGYGLFDLGYAFRAGDAAIIYPMIGVGGGGISMLITDRDGVGLGPNLNDPTFDEVLDDPGRRSQLTRGSMLFNVGVGTEVPLSTRFMLSARAGYLMSAGGDRWRLYDTQVIGGPRTAFEGLHLRLGVGIGHLR